MEFCSYAPHKPLETLPITSEVIPDMGALSIGGLVAFRQSAKLRQNNAKGLGSSGPPGSILEPDKATEVVTSGYVEARPYVPVW